MFRGFATISFYADDVAAARDWYAQLLGVEAYYEVPSGPSGPDAPAPPAYVEFRIGDFPDELGIIDRRFAPPGAANAPGGAIMSWHVDDLEATFETLLSLGATVYEPITPRGDQGFVTASVVDPFGNVLGIMTNPHYLEMLATKRS